MIGHRNQPTSGVSNLFGSSDSNETLRQIKHGRIRPMHEPSFLERLFGRN